MFEPGDRIKLWLDGEPKMGPYLLLGLGLVPELDPYGDRPMKSGEQAYFFLISDEDRFDSRGGYKYLTIDDSYKYIMERVEG